MVGQDKDAFFTKGFDADSFFVALTRELGIFPPDLVARPFTYVQRALTSIAPFVEPMSREAALEDDVMRTPRAWIKNAIAQFEQPAWEIITQGVSPDLPDQERAMLYAVAARYLLMAGRHEEVLRFRKEYNAAPSPEFSNVLSMAYVLQGNVLLDRAKATSDVQQADQLFTEAKAMYESAIVVKPDRSEALHNWGNLLLDEAKRATGALAERLFSDAEEKYRQALAIDPKRYEVLRELGESPAG